MSEQMRARMGYKVRFDQPTTNPTNNQPTTSIQASFDIVSVWFWQMKTKIYCKKKFPMKGNLLQVHL